MSDPADLPTLLENCTLEAFVPEDDDFDLGSLPASRQALFLDELTTICVVLQCPLVSEEKLKPLLNAIQITLEAFAVGTSRSTSDAEAKPAPIKDLVESRLFDASEDPLVAVQAPDTERPVGRIHVLWKAQIHINRTRIRSSNPSIYLAATANLSRNTTNGTHDYEEEYLPSGVPSSINLLEAFHSDPDFHGKPPVLTAARLSKMIPLGAQARDQERPIRNMSTRQLLRVLPAVSTRWRFSKVGMSPDKAKMLASLDVQVSQFVDGKITFESLDVSLSEGRAEPLIPATTLQFPLLCAQHDHLCLIYNLLPNHRPPTSPHTHFLSLTLVATINSPDLPTRPIRTQWRTPIDLSVLHRPPALSNPLLAITVTSESVHPPRWSLLITNRSSRALNLALIPLIPGLPTPAVAPGLDSLPPSLYAAPDAELGPALIPHVADLRVSLAPGTCAEREVRFEVLRKGAHEVGLRVVDLDVLQAKGRVTFDKGEKAWTDVQGLTPVVVAEELGGDLL